MGNKLILLSGVHGVGKSYFLKDRFACDARFEVVSASDLIGRFKKADDAGYKKVYDVQNNQQILLTELLNEKNRVSKDIILDGHICILNETGTSEYIPEKFFLDAGVNGIILLQDDVDIIAQRQDQRDGLVLDKNIIREMQEKEKWYCERLFSKYNIGHHVIDSTCEYSKFCKIVDRL